MVLGTPALTHSLTHTLTHSLTHSLFHSVSLSLSVTHTLIHSLTHSLTHSLSLSLSLSLFLSLVEGRRIPLFHSLRYTCTHPGVIRPRPTNRGGPRVLLSPGPHLLLYSRAPCMPIIFSVRLLKANLI